MSTLTSPHKTLLLDSLRIQGERYDCGLSALAAICSALRKTNLAARSMAEIMNKPRRRGLLVVARPLFPMLGEV